MIVLEYILKWNDFQVRKKKTDKMVLTPVRRSKRNQTGNTNTVDTAKIGDTVELTEVCSKTGETVMDGVIVIID